jgi:hypothetical protein
MPAPTGTSKNDSPATTRSKISVIGKKSGQTILIPMRRLSNADCRSNLPGGKRLCPREEHSPDIEEVIKGFKP